MDLTNLTDKDLENFRCYPKRSLKRPKEHSQYGHTEQDYTLIDDNKRNCSLYVRQNERIKNNFSCGILVILDNGEKLTLARYNGNDHPHLNPIEKTRFIDQYHIHLATERYIAFGKKPDKYAEITNRYATLKGALNCLVTDYHIAGIETEPDQADLF